MRRRSLAAAAAGTAWLALGAGVLPPAAQAFASVSAERDTLRVPADIRPAVVKVGERVRVRFAVALPDTTARLIGPRAPESFGAVDVLASGPSPAGADSAGWSLEVALFQPGDQDLTALPFVLQSEAGERPVRLLTYTLSVEATLPDTAGRAELRDIRGPVKVPLHWRWGRVVMALLVVGVAGAAFVLWRRRRAEAPPEPAFVGPTVSPEEAALAALRDLERDALPARGLMKEHYFRLSLVLRGYLERRFSFPAVESTTEEIREAMDRRRVLPGADRDDALELFTEADLVKFARFDPGATAGDAALRRGRDWVERVGARTVAVADPSAGPAPPDAEAER
jgi:hypothetical protein